MTPDTPMPPSPADFKTVLVAFLDKDNKPVWAEKLYTSEMTVNIAADTIPSLTLELMLMRVDKP